MLRVVLLLIQLAFCDVCFCFFPTPESVEYSWTHSSITRSGLYKGAATYLKTSGLVTDVGQSDFSCVEGFFGSDADGFGQFENIINEIIGYNNAIQKEMAGVARRSFNGEAILTGNRDKELKEVAPATENTCRSASFDVSDITAGSCNNNLMTTKLTSGYRSNQDKRKPLSGSRTQGKCSHGGIYDTTRQLVATCGINKETSHPELSPHYDLHDSSATAAIKATESFLIRDDDGILQILGEPLFKEVFGLISKTADKSLAFVVDVTGSMGNDIEYVRQWTINKVTSVINSVTEPLDYVLATFSDPESLTTGTSTENGYEMLNLLRGLTASGGDDCPEYALSGIEKAITLTTAGSTLFVFTDASAKDTNRFAEIGSQLGAKNLRMKFILTGTCSKRKRRSKEQSEQSDDSQFAHRVKRQTVNTTYSVYENLAALTGGKVYETNSASIGNVLNIIFSESFPSADVIVDFKVMNTTHADFIDFFVDETLFTLRITAFGAESETDINVASPNGILIEFSSTNNTRVLTDSDRVDITIQMPSTGKWRIYRNISRDWNINITGQSFLDFTYKIMQKADDGNIYVIEGNPIQGENYTIVIGLLGSSNASVTSLICVSTDGTEVSTYTLADKSSNSERRYIVQIVFGSEELYFKIQGLDRSGNEFTRLQWIQINPVSVKLYIVPVYGQLLVGRETSISYSISNLGESAETIEASVTNDKGYSLSPTSRSHSISLGETITDIFTVRPDHDNGVMLYTISISKSGTFGTTSILQVLSKRLSVTTIQHPECSILYTVDSCPVASITASNCNSSQWFVITETAFSDISIKSVSLSVPDARIQITHGDIAALNGPLQVNMSGNCCSGSAQLIILDSDGYMGTCNVDFNTHFVTGIDDAVSDEVKNNTLSMPESQNRIIIGVTVGCVVAVVIAAIIVIKIVQVKSVKKYSIDPTNTLSNAQPKTDNVSKQKYLDQHLHQSNGWTNSQSSGLNAKLDDV